MTLMTDESEDDRIRRLVTGEFKPRLPKRFYKQVTVGEGNAVLLDGRPVKTPLKSSLQLPSIALAQAVAAEWQAQEKEIDPAAMPLTKLANTAIDRATTERQHVLKEIVDYAGSDLVCYWADRPPELVQRQRQHWQPVLDWHAAQIGATFSVVQGMMHVAQPQAALDVIAERAAALDAWQLTALYLLTTLTGSALIAFMMQQGALSAEDAWAAAHVDEDYQISQWGEDWEAAQRRAARRREFDGPVQFIGLIG